MKNILNKEDYFIKQFTKSKFIGDDGAVVGNYVYSMDAFFEDVHFKTKWMRLKQIATKAMLVNISDAIVMNAIPKYALLSVAIPSTLSKKDMKELSKGFKKTAKKFNIEIIGGDTISNNKLDISVTIVSKIKKNQKPVLRSGTNIGDIVCYTNSLGSVKKDLDCLLENKQISKKSKFIKPILNPKFFYRVAKHINSAMDISDGLFFELERLSKTNNIGFDFLIDIDKELGCSGEEYEILFTFDKKHKKKIEKIAKECKVKLNFVATTTKGSFTCDCKSHHFK
ncbi:MAG: thiamine-phosphate kinase [Campylobacterota bacterium]|nr:thiamine-phosphate kinase [Campylobacterota bacterium]